MPRRQYARGRSKEKIDDAVIVLESGFDFFGDFKGPDAETELHELWNDLGEEITAQHVAQDSTTRPMAWWWWTAPETIRLPVFQTLCRIEQRQDLLAAKVLDPAAAKIAREKIREWKRSGQPMFFFKDRTPRPEIVL